MIVNKYKKFRPFTGSILYTMNGSQSMTVVALFYFFLECEQGNLKQSISSQNYDA